MIARLTRWICDTPGLCGARQHQRGQAASEYVVVISVLALMLFTPFVDLDGQRYSIFMLFIKAFDIYINSFHTVITLPIP